MRAPTCISTIGSYLAIVKLIAPGELREAAAFSMGDTLYQHVWMSNGQKRQRFGRGGAALTWNKPDTATWAKQLCKEERCRYVEFEDLAGWAAENAKAAAEYFHVMSTEITYDDPSWDRTRDELLGEIGCGYERIQLA